MNKIRLITVFLACMAISITGVADAKLYRWVDENGVSHYSNVAPPQNKENVHAGAEAQSSTSSGSSSKGLETVLDSYKQDGLTLESEAAEKAAQRTSVDRKKSDRQYHKKKAAYYKHELEGEQLDLKARQEKLDRYKRRSYTDAQHHKKMVQIYEDHVIQSKHRIEQLKHEYDYHKKRSR